MDQLDVALASIAATVLALGLFSQLLERMPVQAPLLATMVGIAIGPRFAGWLDVSSWGDTLPILEDGARLTLAIAIMAVALRISRGDLRRHWSAGTLLATLGLLGMWVSTTAIVWWVLGLPLWLSALIGAVITPTDPVVASAIVTGPFAQKHLPNEIRTTLSFESGANDGLAYLLVMLPILLHLTPAEGWSRWLFESLLLGVVAAIVLGVLLGVSAAWLLHWARRRGMMETYSFLSFTVALSLFTLGASTLLRAESLLSVFAAGLAFDLVADTGEKHEEENVQEAISKLFTLPMFVLFGAAVPWDAWARLGAPLWALAALVLLLRRLPVLLSLAPLLRRRLSWRDVSFLGWFGPLGIAAVFYAAFAVQHTGQDIIWSVASAVVFASILAHGISAAPFTRLYARGRQTSERG